MFIVAVLLGVIGLSFLAECYLVNPVTSFRHRSCSALALHSMAVVFIFIAVFIVFRRVVFSASLSLGLHFLIIAINNAKYQALKENIVFSDLVMFLQAFQFPRLYFPFVNSLLLIIFPAAILVLLVIGLSMELPIYLSTDLNDTVIYLAINSGLFFVMTELAKKQVLSLQPCTDLQNLGLLSSIIIGTVQAQQKTERKVFAEQLTNTSFSKLSHADIAQELADIIVVQSESFFDIRHLYAAISPEILKNYEVIKLKSSFSGRLNVPAWGANTVRSEFAFLSGLHDERLGLFRYYPYHYIQTEVCTIAGYLKRQGYRTICIHPYAAAFFERQRVFLLLGFDEFIDISEFSEHDIEGAYISDVAVAKKIIHIQESSDQPVFIFAITMENHGPLHLENVTTEDESAFYQIKPDFDAHDMTAYLRHLKNADAMMAYLVSHFEQISKSSCLCFYGDHVPSMPVVYQALEFENSQSDYFIWESNNKESGCNHKTIDINQLGLLLIENVLLKK